MPERTRTASPFAGPARAALLEVTPTSTVGEWIADREREPEDGVRLVDVVFESTQRGYAGWSWIVTVATLADAEPTVLELGLIPGEGALLSPEWIPWSVRLAEWKAQQAALKEAGEVTEEDEVEIVADDEIEDDDEDEDAEDDDAIDDDDDVDLPGEDE